MERKRRMLIPPTASRKVRCVASSLLETSHSAGIGRLRSSRIWVVAIRAPARTMGTLRRREEIVSVDTF